jgi:hypothetical protein
MLQEEVKKHKENSDKYRLFIGFKKLGEFGSISEAQQHANESGLSGVFNLTGDRYHDKMCCKKFHTVSSFEIISNRQ